ncbi:hypothetical protein RCH21_000216 [Arthrobacter sp. PL16]|uniref:DUF4129 domain-containing protein n=1 Tax=Arthrobacter sp. PL16 TaxID=3071720 RepID=UPI002E014769|nr:hypothetical protein [Arthrobacter sp. PL16]
MIGGPTASLTPDGEEARRLLEEELAKAAYAEAQPNVFERILAEVLRGIARVFDGIGGLGAGPGTLVVAIGAALIITVAIVLIKPRLNARGRKEDTAVFDEGTRYSAARHRSRASALASAADWNGAVAEVLRAIIRSAEERLVIAEQPGRTATEAAVQLANVFPPLSADIAWLADLFNETVYGSGKASGEEYRRAAAVDDRFSTERPEQSLHAEGTTTPAAPQ